MLNEKLKSKIHDLLNERCFKDDQGLFYTEIYADYRDDIPENWLKKLSEAENPRDTFHDCVMDAYESCEHDDSYEMLQQICRNEMIAEAINQGETSEDEIREYLWDHHYVQLPYDHFLKQDIAVDILLDTGDANYDFTLNQPFASWDGQSDKTIDECSALLWLSRQQGYSKRQLTNALKHGEFQESKFLKSVHWEVCNTSSGINALTFLVQITLENYLKLLDAIKKEAKLNASYYPKERKGRGYIIIDKKTTCGLYDSWNGSGSMLEIDLEKDIRLPIRMIHSALPDCIRRYNIREIWGLCTSAWSDNAVKEIHPMRKAA